MTVVSQQDFATQMIAQLRALDPAISAEIGTPERKIIDTVAQALAETQIDLTVLSGALDLDSKFGTQLDSFLSLLGFGRQQSVKATGFVTFSRPTASTFAVLIPVGTQLVAPGVTVDGNTTTNVVFQTTLAVTLQAGDTSVSAPVEAIIAGEAGNVGANAITLISGQTPLGVTTVTNPTPTRGGIDLETDDEFKVRFKNTVFRNLAGTPDQYLALAVATAFTTKANVVGPISRYQEYVQVPDVDDASADPDSGITGSGAAGDYTSALSTVPYSKHIYDTIPYFVSNGKSNSELLFFRQDSDYFLNTAANAKNKGDTYRQKISGVGIDPNSADATYKPNVTFRNVYTGGNPDILAIRPSDVVLFEHSYLSTASRNDAERNVHNCVDIYVNGINLTQADAVVPPPLTTTAFVNNSASPYYFENYRRFGQPNHRPVIGNLFMPLFFQPVMQLPDEILVGDTIYVQNIHYWLIEDVSEIGGSVRGRSGIEWSVGVNGIASNDPEEGPWTGAKIAAQTDVLDITGYFYDKNIVDLQASLEGAKQTTTDVLAHQATTRYFKLDVTVMYVGGLTPSDVNINIRDNLKTFFNNAYYGSAIQLSDLLAVIHDTPGVDNVRWSQDLLSTRNRVIECDKDGNPLLNIVTDRKVWGDTTTVDIQQYYITGNPTQGTYTLSYQNITTAPIAYNANLATVNAALSDAAIPATATGAGTAENPFVLTFSSTGVRSPIIAKASFTAGEPIFNTDFFLQDNELPALPTGSLNTDSVEGLILRPRAQNTWSSL